jgi:hypothetical protein
MELTNEEAMAPSEAEAAHTNQDAQLNMIQIAGALGLLHSPWLPLNLYQSDREMHATWRRALRVASIFRSLSPDQFGVATVLSYGGHVERGVVYLGRPAPLIRFAPGQNLFQPSPQHM